MPDPEPTPALPQSLPAPVPPAPAPSSPAAATQLKDLPLPELQAMARDFGLDPSGLDTKPGLVAAILDRRTLIASLDRDAMVDVLHWAGRQTTPGMSRERIAVEIAKIRSMRFSGLSQRGLVVLSRLRGLNANERDSTPDLISKLKNQESLFAKLGRKRRALMGKWVSKMLGEDKSSATAEQTIEAEAGQRDGPRANVPRGTPPTRSAAAERGIKDEIEEAGLIAGLTSRVRRSADQYLNQKLDEIEARIDRKLDEIDRRLAEWRDKEVANRIRILKISLWATVVVGAATLIISYVRVYMPWMFGR